MKTFVKISVLTLSFLTACFVSNVNAQDDRVASKVTAEIQDFIKQFEQGFNNLDAGSVGSSYAQDAVMTVEDGSSVKGRDAIQQWYQDGFEALKPSVEVSVGDVVVISSTAAQVTGKYTVSFTDKESGKPMEVNGTFSMLLKKPSSGWQIVRELDSAAPAMDAKEGVDDKN